MDIYIFYGVTHIRGYILRRGEARGSRRWALNDRDAALYPRMPVSLCTPATYVMVLVLLTLERFLRLVACTFSYIDRVASKALGCSQTRLPARVCV